MFENIKLLIKIPSIKKAECQDASQIQILQERRFRHLLRHVLLNSRFYRQYYKEHGITIDMINKIKLKDLPIIDKRIMMENYDDLVCDSLLKKEDLVKFISNPLNRGKKYKRKFQVIHTSGSTGHIGIFVYGPDDWALLKALAICRVTKNKISFFRKSKLAFIGATDGNYAGISLSRDAPRLFFDFLPLNINRPLDEIITKINEFQPDTIAGYSSGAYLLAGEQLKGNIKIKVNRIICSGDSLTPKMRQTVTDAFGIKPTGFYASSESVGMGAECDIHEGIHLFNDWHCFEVVDDNLDEVKPGKSGKLIMTNLYNYTQPLIRYKMDDELVLDVNASKCRWPFPIVKNIAGREEDFLWFKKSDGKEEYIHPLVMVEFFVPGVEKFQVIQAKRDMIVMKAVIRGEREKTIDGIRMKMKEILQNKGLENIVDIRVEIVEEIQNDPKTGKYRLIVPFN